MPVSRAWPFFWAALYGVLALLALAMARQTEGLAYIWPASGVAVTALLLCDHRQRRDFLGLLAITCFAINLWDGQSYLLAVGFALANAIECWLVVRLCRVETHWHFNKPRWVARFIGSAMVGSTASAVIASNLSSSGGMVFILSWFATSLLGILIVTPILTLSVFKVGGQWRAIPKDVARIGPFLVLSLIASFVTFGQSIYPILFVPLAAVVIAAFSGGVPVAALSVTIIAIVGSLLTMAGFGPVHLVEGSNFEKIVFFQVYLLVCLLCALPTASLLTRYKHVQDRLRTQNDLLSMAEKMGKIGHWHFVVGDDHVHWSDEVFRIHGLLPKFEKVPINKAISFYHEEDRKIVQAALDAAIESGEPYCFRARIIRLDGETRIVETRGMAEKGQSSGGSVFGVIIDVTDHAHIIRDLQRAKKTAESQAREARQLADTDQLTGAASRRKFLTKLSSAISRAEKSGSSLSFILFDIDHFKAINDTYGHTFGDRVLRELAGTVQSCLRSSDILGRLGGEEFGVVLPDAGLKRAEGIAERIRQAVASKDFDELSLVSVSIGIAEYRPGADSEWLIQAADIALYQAKRNGRNRLEIAA